MGLFSIANLNQHKGTKAQPTKKFLASRLFNGPWRRRKNNITKQMIDDMSFVTHSRAVCVCNRHNPLVVVRCKWGCNLFEPALPQETNLVTDLHSLTLSSQNKSLIFTSMAVLVPPSPRDQISSDYTNKLFWKINHKFVNLWFLTFYNLFSLTSDKRNKNT